jgi:O-antigen/teichoic acid export membrane protein
MNETRRSRGAVFGVIRSFGLLTSGKMSGDVFTFALFVVLSRRYGEEGLGQYAFAMGLGAMPAVVAEFGLYYLSMKELSRDPQPDARPFAAIFPLRLALCATALAAMIPIAAILPFSTQARLVILIIGVYQILYTLLDGLAAGFVARNEAHIAASLEFSLRASIGIPAGATALAGASIVTALAAFPALTLGHLAIAYGLTTHGFARPWLAASPADLLATAGAAIPYALSSLLFPLASRIDVICLGLFIAPRETGIYNAAYRLVFAFLLMSFLAGVAVLPLASRLYVADRRDFTLLYHRSVGLTVLVGLPIGAGLALLAEPLVTLVFGSSFRESAAVLRTLAWLVPVVAARNMLDAFLMAADRQARRTTAQWTAAVLSVLANLLLVPYAGVFGAVTAVLLSEVLLLGLFLVQLQPVCGWPHVGSRLAIASLATAGFLVSGQYLESLPVVVTVPAAATLYAAAVLLLPDIRRVEGAIMRELLSGSIRPLRRTGTPL